MNAEIIAVGSELLTPSRVDTNSLYLTGELNTLGVEVVAKSIIGDDRTRLTEAIRGALSRTELLILTGGLGPTEDDVTRDAVATAAGLGQQLDPEIVAGIAARFRQMGRRMAENNERQGMVIDGAEILPNPRGTAPGQMLRSGKTLLFLLPGPPGELKPMFTAQCLPRLAAILPAQIIRTRFYRVAGMGESDVDALVAPVYTRYENPVTTILAAAGDIQLHLRARCATAEECEALLAEVGGQIEPLLGDRLYTKTGEPLEAVIGQRLCARGQTLAVAESLTGGAVAERLTQLPGSSAYFVGGFLAYTDEMKAKLLGVGPELLRTHSAVSEPVAEAMARGARERTGADYALALTGYAGPDGGTERDPVGTVYLGFASATGCHVQRLRWVGDRSRIRTLATQYGLDLVRRQLG